jgi:hypothetical protein
LIAEHSNLAVLFRGKIDHRPDLAVMRFDLVIVRDDRCGQGTHNPGQSLQLFFDRHLPWRLPDGPQIHSQYRIRIATIRTAARAPGA